MEAILEGLLFVVGDEGISKEEIKNILNINDNSLEEIINKLIHDYSNKNRGITLELLGDKYKLTTKKEHHEYYEKLTIIEQTKELSQSALETLAIIAYNEPITRSQIDEIRGSVSDYLVKKLLLRDLIKEVGKAELPGRPTLFATTTKFLDYFGLKNKNELPEIKIEEIQQDEINLFDSKYKETDTN